MKNSKEKTDKLMKHANHQIRPRNKPENYLPETQLLSLFMWDNGTFETDYLILNLMKEFVFGDVLL